MLIKNIPNIYNNAGINIINANNIGNNTVQQNDINWSKRILGNDALTQININTIIELLIPKVNPLNNPSIVDPVKKSLIAKYSEDVIHSILNAWAYI